MIESFFLGALGMLAASLIMALLLLVCELALHLIRAWWKHKVRVQQRLDDFAKREPLAICPPLSEDELRILNEWRMKHRAELQQKLRAR